MHCAGVNGRFGCIFGSLLLARHVFSNFLSGRIACAGSRKREREHIRWKVEGDPSFVYVVGVAATCEQNIKQLNAYEMGSPYNEPWHHDMGLHFGSNSCCLRVERRCPRSGRQG